MNRGTPLTRVTPLRQTTPRERQAPAHDARFPVILPGAAPVLPLRKRPRDTGPSPAVRTRVLKRDGYRCVRCGRPAGPGIGSYSIQHRVARSTGGGNTYPNLILLCGSATTGCHGDVEARHPADLAAGYRLESWQDPAAEPVTLHSHCYGHSRVVWLTSDGQYSRTPPSGGAA
jgi:hypothetical protein